MAVALGREPAGRDSEGMPHPPSCIAVFAVPGRVTQKPELGPVRVYWSPHFPVCRNPVGIPGTL